MNQTHKTIVAYICIAFFTTIANLLVQSIVISAGSGKYIIEISVLAGTAIGLPLKYILDKRYIFKFKAASLLHDGRIFSFYCFVGFITTVLFWATEFGFEWLFKTDLMRYVGGGIGLSIGYIAKYFLDAKFVFSTPNSIERIM